MVKFSDCFVVVVGDQERVLTLLAFLSKFDMIEAFVSSTILAIQIVGFDVVRRIKEDPNTST